jgi:hypothetical protein
MNLSLNGAARSVTRSRHTLKITGNNIHNMGMTYDL